jgi:hypothetical protein
VVNAKSNFSNNGKLSLWLDRSLAIGIALFVIGLTFQLVIKGVVPGPIGTYWKEALLGVLLVVWVVRSFLARRLQIDQNILTYAILIYAGLIMLRLLVDVATLVAAWGLYFSILYLPLVLLVPVALRRNPNTLIWFIGILVGLGGVVALGGVIEFILNRPLWPSAELTTLQGFPDMYIYGTHLRRVYFVFDSPTTLANTLALLLPLSIYMVFYLRRIALRIASGIAAILMFICILFTFSRGIWVAVALAAIAIIVLKIFIEGNRRIIQVGLGIAVTAGVIFIAVQLMRPVTTITDQYTIELSASLYKQVPVEGTPLSLMDKTPQNGSVEFQNWTLFDPIGQSNDTRTVLYSPPKADGPSEVIYRVTIPDSGALLFFITLDPKVWAPDRGDGVDFKVFLNDPENQNSGSTVFLRYINPKSNPTDRRWRNYVIDLSGWSGKTVDLYLITDSGPQSDYSYDWAGWGGLQLVSIPQSYLAMNLPKPQNPVIAHMASIIDWARDPSNQDRLLAWNLGINAWLKSPFWGNGLGTTGEAALRTMPGTGFVTESQLLKSLVELGIPGFLTWAFLWFTIGQFAIRLYKKTEKPEQRMLVLGILCSLIIVFIDGLVYQNLEVKQVNAIFWSLVGVLIYLKPVKPDSALAKGS